ncbi:hypothetical protein SSYIS1_26150 [Serratia symbiotica]|uniref:Uncharacterized protein n=1 Tax=Serratia symbiotica TaxID=138074 RepID=A0A455VJG1_9GAMM|nr:hypothetical protein SSYIS1_26150 [Serratia symbiotica]
MSDHPERWQSSQQGHEHQGIKVTSNQLKINLITPDFDHRLKRL